MANTRSARRLHCEALEDRCLLASTSTLTSTDFTALNAWPSMTASSSTGGSAVIIQGDVGTIDVEGSATASGGLRLTETPPAVGAWSSTLGSGTLALANIDPTLTNLGKLTLSFTLSATQAEPVKLRVYSYASSTGAPTGSLVTTILPAATYYNQRFALDLSTMTPAAGTFNPTAPFVSFDFAMDSQAGWSAALPTQLRLDNVNYAKPAYYVSPTGGNNGGKTEANAFKTPQQALNVAQPGDIILLMNGTYNQVTANTGPLQFQNNSGVQIAGTPAAWISIKNYPGQTPVLYSEAWNAIKIGVASAYPTGVTPNAAIAYVEVRGLTIQGDSAKVGSRTAPDGTYNPSDPAAGQYGVYGQYAGSSSDPRVNSNGISVDGRFETNKPHDIRIADNIVEDMSGAGLGAGDCDRVQIENNICRDNCYWDVYATSGISVLSAYNFDGTSGSYTRLIRNNITSGNIHKEKWQQTGGYSDGNGIIIDINKYAQVGQPGNANYAPARAALGRTLVTNNLSYDNGGGGIHIYNADHVDIINNTAYLNSASPYLKYPAIDAQASSDSRVYNNIAVAPSGSGEPINNSGSASTYKNNVYFGGGVAPIYGTGDILADPKFVLASLDPATANFKLQSTSPAINLGMVALSPALDLLGVTRYSNPDAGAYEFIPIAPASITLAAASDTGVTGDTKTRLNNSSAGAKLSFLVTGTISGANVLLFAGSILVGTATASGASTTVITDGTTALANGLVSLTAVQMFAGAPSAASAASSITVDSVLPTLVGMPVVNAGTAIAASRSQVRSIAWTFSEPMIAALPGFSLVNTDTGTTVSLSSRSVSVSGNVVTLNLDSFATDPNPGLFLANGNYQLTLLPTITDLAGNAVNGAPAFNFFKLLGDTDGDRSTDFNDFLALQSAFGTSTGAAGFIAACDFDGTGSIDFNDFLVLQTAFGTKVQANTAPAALRGVSVRRHLSTSRRRF